MPSIADTRRHVKENLDQSAQQGVDHDAILAGLQDEIDKHNAVKDDLRSSMRSSKSHRGSTRERSPASLKFRFKSNHDGPRDRKRRSKHHRSDHDRHKSKRSKRDDYPTPPTDSHQGGEEAETHHPFPREPAPLDPSSTEDAFRTSLFDALADDEGAAAYWENIYSQPIHTYPRPSTTTSSGELEEMNDEQYVEYVKQRMWEKKNPEVVAERRKREKERKVEEEERTRRREEFVRRRERVAWERSQRWRGGHGDEKGRYGAEVEEKGWVGDEREEQGRKYEAAWKEYLNAWDALKYDLLTRPPDDAAKAAKRIPWPVLASKVTSKENIEVFLRYAPSDAKHSRTKLLKAERVRWHPDKMQQRFGGKLDDETMKKITAVFQIVDAVYEKAKRNEAG